MFDFKFDWDESLNTGIQDVDEQHQKFFRIARDIEQLILTDCRATTEERLLATLCELREYTTYHFYAEEQILAKVNPSALEEHKKRHEEFKGKINSVDCADLIEEPTKELRRILGLLKDWLFHHILMEDLRDLKRS